MNDLVKSLRENYDDQNFDAAPYEAKRVYEEERERAATRIEQLEAEVARLEWLLGFDKNNPMDQFVRDLAETYAKWRDARYAVLAAKAGE